MKVIVNPHKCTIEKTPVNELEVNVTKVEFEFDEVIPSEYVKKAFFTLENTSIEVLLQNNECNIPSEVLTKQGTVELGVIAYEVQNNELIARYNPSPAYFNTWSGSLKEADNTEPITPTDKEQIEQMLSNINIDGNKSGKITTITITYKDGTTKQLQLEDGKSIEYNWQGTQLGIRQEGQSEYEYVDLKGDTGQPGAIKMVIVDELPLVGSGDTLYFVPKEDAETSDIYDEYAWVNNTWERLGEKQIVVDLTNYVKNTDYATNSIGGVIKVADYYGTEIYNGLLSAKVRTYENYQTSGNNLFISKATLENVITGKGLVSNTIIKNANSTTAGDVYDVRYINSLIGDIGTILDSINNEVL